MNLTGTADPQPCVLFGEPPTASPQNANMQSWCGMLWTLPRGRYSLTAVLAGRAPPLAIRGIAVPPKPCLDWRRSWNRQLTTDDHPFILHGLWLHECIAGYTAPPLATLHGKTDMRQPAGSSRTSERRRPAKGFGAPRRRRPGDGNGRADQARTWLGPTALCAAETQLSIRAACRLRALPSLHDVLCKA